MKKLLLAASMVLGLTACYDNEKVVSLDGYWADKKPNITESERDKIKSIFANSNIKRIVQSPVVGVLEVHLVNGSIKYVSKDGTVIIEGHLLSSLDDVNLTNLSRKIIEAEKTVENVLAKKTVSNASNVSDTVSHAVTSQRPLSPQSDSRLTESSSDLEASIRAKIASRKRAAGMEVTKDESLQEKAQNQVNTSDSVEATENEFRNKNSMDINLVENNESHILYKQTKLAKIGFDKDGNKVSDEEKRSQMLRLMENIRSKGDQWSMLYLSAASEKKGEIVVFTDPTCPHCKVFHQNMGQILDMGYDIRYMFFPRYLALGLDNPKAQTNLRIIKSIWCADDRIAEAHKIYNQGLMTPFTCEGKPNLERTFPANEHYVLGLVTGIDSTPSVILPNGDMVAGFNMVMKSLAEIEN